MVCTQGRAKLVRTEQFINKRYLCNVLNEKCGMHSSCDQIDFEIQTL